MNSGGPDTRAIPATLAKAKVCPECGQSFMCSELQAGCWCAQKNICAETLAALRAQSADCVCPGCLTAAESRARLIADGRRSQAKND